jgi:hypothetical protein
MLAQDQVIQDAPSQASGSGTYGIVVSPDKQNDLAAYEVQRLKRLGYTDLAVYDRQGVLRTVACFGDRESAETKLPMIQGYRKTTYVINLDKWCADPQDSGKQIDGVPIFACRSGRME